MPDETIRVIYLQEGRRAEIREIEESLKEMQALVRGSIEEYMPFKDPVAIVCNMEGKLRGLDPNREVYDEYSGERDIIRGDFFLCYARPDSEVYESMPPEMEEKYRRKFDYPEQFFQIGDDIRAVKYDPDRENNERDEGR